MEENGRWEAIRFETKALVDCALGLDINGVIIQTEMLLWLKENKENILNQLRMCESVEILRRKFRTRKTTTHFNTVALLKEI